MSFGVGPRFTLTGPPRWVPLLVRLRLGWGGTLQQVGWIILGFGSLMSWVLEVPQNIYLLAMFRGPLVTAEAVVKQAERTNVKVNKREVFQYRFEFQHENETYQGSSYETGSSLSAGSRVVAEFPENHPELARVRGKRATLLGWPAVFFGIVPGVGCVLIFISARQGRRHIHLLAEGIQTTGKLVRREPTGMQINNQTVYKLIFEFRAPDGQLHEACAKTHETEKLLDDLEEPLLYLPHQPDVSCLIDNLPGTPRVDELGDIRVSQPLRAVFSLLLPVVVLGGNGIYIYEKFFA